MANAVDKSEYLKRYLSSDSSTKAKKKKIRKAQPTKQSKINIIDDDVGFVNHSDNGENIQKDQKVFHLSDSDDEPQIAEVIDERPINIRKLEEFHATKKWKTINEDDNLNNPYNHHFPSRSIDERGNVKTSRIDTRSNKSTSGKNSELLLRVQKKSIRNRLNKSDSDESPPRHRRNSRSPSKQSHYHPSSALKRADSKEQSHGRTKNDDSGSDQSPPRRTKSRRIDSSSGQSPPRRAKSRRNDSGSDQSPPRRTKSRRNDSGADQSPPRKTKSRRNDSGSDQSPPRRTKSRRNYSGSDQSPPRMTKTKDANTHHPQTMKNDRRPDRTLDGKRAGLQDGRSMQAENAAARLREKEAFDALDAATSGRNAEVVYRDRHTGFRRDLKEERRLQKLEESKKAEAAEKYAEWGKGVSQVEQQKSRLESDVAEMSKPLARYADDVDLDRQLRNQDREGDPMLALGLLSKKKSISGKPKYNGPPPPTNRFGILPGYRWDGVDRSSGFEKKFFDRINQKKAVSDDAYKWSTEDM